MVARLFALAIMFFAMLAHPALSAEIAIVGDTITFSGDIKSGDLSDLTNQVFKAQSVKPRPLTLSLNSNGNNFEEAVLISLFTHQSGIATLVKSGNRCNSACALIFLGGTSIDGGETGSQFDRNLEVGAELGFHLPFTPDAQRAIVPTQKGLSETEAILQLKVLFDKLDVPQSIRSKLMQNDSTHSLYDATTVEALELLEINVEGLTVQAEKITRSMAINGCINSYRLARKDLPSLTFAQDMAQLQGHIASSPIVTPEGDASEFALIPTVNHGNEGIAICRIGTGGECQGFYPQSAMSNLTRGEEQISDLSECQRQSNVSVLVSPDIRLAMLDTELTNLQKQEPALLRGDALSNPAQPPSAAGDEDAASGDEEDGDITEVTPQQTPDAVPEQKKIQDYIVVAVPQRAEVICNNSQKFANVRAGPNSKNFVIVSTLINQTPVTVIGNTKNPETNHPWYEIGFAGGRGFVDSELVQRSCLVALAQPEAPAPLSVPERRTAFVCNAKGDSANVRSAPNPKASTILRKIFNKEQLDIIGEANNPESGQLYFKVDAQGVIGFVDSELVSTRCNFSDTAFTGGAAFMCNKNLSFTNMRSGPSPKQFGIIAELTNNTSIMVLDRTTNPDSGAPWLRIEAEGQTGFVDATSVSDSPCATIIQPQPAAFESSVMCNPNLPFTNMRLGPNAKQFEVIAQLNNGQAVRVLESTSNPESGALWHKIEADGLVGFVDASMVSGSGC